MTKPITKEELWSKVQAEFFTKLGRVTFSTYIEPLKPLTLGDTSLTLAVPSDMAQDIIDQWDSEYSMDFVQFAMSIADGFIKPDLQVAEAKPTTIPTLSDNLSLTRESDLNPDFTF